MKCTMIRARGGAWGAAAVLAFLLTVAAASPGAQGDRAAAQAILGELGRDASHRATVADAVARAQDALERGTRMRVARDDPHATEAESVARQWAETARELVRAADSETRANEIRKKALETETQVAKTRELVEEVIARTGRLRAQIQAAQRAEGPPRMAVEVHDGERAPAKRPATPPARAAMSDGGAP
jgi:hypothetical protein